MSGDINLQAQARAWLTHSVLQPHVSRYAEHLDRGRYAPNTRRVYLCCVAHFALWGLEVDDREVAAVGGRDNHAGGSEVDTDGRVLIVRLAHLSIIRLCLQPVTRQCENGC